MLFLLLNLLRILGHWMTFYLDVKRLCPSKRGAVDLLYRSLGEALNRFDHIYCKRRRCKVRAQMSVWVYEQAAALDRVKIFFYLVDSHLGNAFVVSVLNCYKSYHQIFESDLRCWGDLFSVADLFFNRLIFNKI